MSVWSLAVSSDDDVRVLIGQNIVLSRRKVEPPLSQGDVLRAQLSLLDEGERPFVRQELSAWENGHKRPSDARLRLIGLITGRSLGWFYESHDDEED